MKFMSILCTLKFSIWSWHFFIDLIFQSFSIFHLPATVLFCLNADFLFLNLNFENSYKIKIKSEKYATWVNFVCLDVLYLMVMFIFHFGPCISPDCAIYQQRSFWHFWMLFLYQWYMLWILVLVLFIVWYQELWKTFTMIGFEF